MKLDHPSRMIYHVITLTLIIFGCVADSASVTSSAPGSRIDHRKQRAFSLFTVVTFPNRQCIVGSDNTMFGNCLTSTECSDRGGSADGNCASGFGVCCKFIVEDCPDDRIISRNCTYIQSPGFDADFTSTSVTCRFSFTSVTSDICQLRYDFHTVILNVPDTANGECTGRDTLTVTSSTGRSPPVVCGTLTGSHMYSEVGTSSDAGNIQIAIGSETFARKFRIKVSQIECTNPNRAPSDCVQYFTGPQGTFSSYNFPRILRTQFMDYCIRQEEGFCTIGYKQSAIATPIPFKMGTATTSRRKLAACAPRKVVIKTSQATAADNNVDSYCGTNLAADQGDDIGSTIKGTVAPFVVSFLSSSTGTPTTEVTGFLLDYNQIPCGVRTTL